MSDDRSGDVTTGRDGGSRISRRKLLALASGGVASLAGCSALESDTPPTPAPPNVDTETPRPGDQTERTTTPEDPLAEFDRVVHAVDDVGCDPSGESACDAAIREGAADGVAIRFPAGTYRFDDGLRFEQLSRLGFVGDGDVTFVPPQGFNDKLIGFVGGQLLFRGIDVDVSAQDTTAGLRFITQSGFRVEDVEFRGRGTHPDESVVNALSLAVEDPSKTGTVRNLVARKGSAIAHYKNGTGRVGVWIGERHNGHVRVEDCRLEEFGNNGIYASRCFGTTEVIGGYFRNNNTCGVRLGGEGNAIRGCRIEVDLDAYGGPMTMMEDDYNTRAIVVEQGPFDKSGRVLIEDCDIRMTKADHSQGAVVSWPTGEGPRIVRSRITTEVDWVPAIRGVTPLPKVEARDRAIELLDTTISGGAARGSAIELRSRPGSTIERTTIEQSGGRRDGLQLLASNPCTLASTSVTSSRYPVFAIDPQTGSSQCLVYLWGDTRLDSSGPDPGSVRKSEIGAGGGSRLPAYQLPLGAERRCVGDTILAELDSPTGIGITRVEESSVTWTHHSSIETATER